ncbi:Flp pilus assembly protein CpaB [Pectobacterium cacticida]|uniref:Flp pilus assembly protein CpaB n=1 Tax=Pectobacterium cacticida TaxID=69221 RepID=UPI002FEF8978
MKVNSTYLLSGACIVAGIVALAVRSHLASPPPPPPAPVVVKAPEKVQILVARKVLRPGDFIDPSYFDWREPTDEEKPIWREFTFVKNKDRERLQSLLGATVRERVAQGQALTSNVVVQKDDPGFVSAVLHKGMRAISVPTNAVASNAGLVAAGDRVDIILSLRKDEQPELVRGQMPSSWVVPPSMTTISVAKPFLASESIVCDLRVLALNNQTYTDVRPRQDVIAEEQLNAVEKSRLPASAPSRSRSTSYQTVTLEVTPKQAEILAVAKEVGMLHLAIRSASDDTDNTCKPTNDALASAPSAHSGVTSLSQSTDIYNSMSGIPAGRQVKIYRGGQKEVQTFSPR